VSLLLILMFGKYAKWPIWGKQQKSCQHISFVQSGHLYQDGGFDDVPQWRSIDRE
jgi:hypothetical protein